MQAGIRRVLSVTVLIVLLGLPLSAMAAQGQATFTLTVKSAFAHTSTSLASTHAASLFQDQTFMITGRSADEQWLRLDYAGARTEVWILAALGTVGGNLDSVPVATAAEPADVPAAEPGPGQVQVA